MKKLLIAVAMLCVPVLAQRPALVSPVIRFQDANGKPLVGGKLFSYQAGTTTPLATYVDSTTSAVNTNPTILDSTGSASVFLSNNVYKLVLQNSAGVVQWTADNISQIGFGSNNVITAASVTAGSYAFGPITTQYLVTDGDSITAGAFLPSPGTQSWPSQLSQLPFFKNRATLINAAVSGQGCAAMTSRYALEVQPYRPNGTTITKSYLTVLIGRNDLNDLADLETCVTNYVTNAANDHFDVTLMTIAPSAMVSVPYPGFSGTWDAITYNDNVNRNAYNLWVRMNSLNVSVFDFAAMITSPYNPLVTFDGTHFTVLMNGRFAAQINTYYQQIQAPSPIQDILPVDGYSGTDQGFHQCGDGAGGDCINAANLSLQIIPSVAGLHVGWNFTGTQTGSIVSVPLTGNGVGIDFYVLHSDGTTPQMLAMMTPTGVTSPNFTANGTGGPGAFAGATFTASDHMESPFYRGVAGQSAFAQGGAGSSFDFTVKNVAGSTNLMLVDESGNTSITGRYQTAVAPPATATTSCATGQFSVGILSSVTYLFVCYAPNLWARGAMTNGGW